MNVKRLFAALGIALLAGGGIVACAESSEPDDAILPDPLVMRAQNSPEGDWRWISAEDFGQEVELSDDVEMTFSLTAARFGGKICNDFSGSAEIDFAENSLSLTPGISTAMACNPPLITENEQWFFDSLTKVASYELDGNLLVLKAPTLSITLEKIPTERLEGTWQLKSADLGTTDAEGFPEHLVNDLPTLRLSFKSSAVTGELFCNTVSASISTVQEHILFSQVTTTEMGCPSDTENTAGWYLRALADSDRFFVSGDQMRLYSPEGVTLYFTKVS